jgi:hypothetical protein
MLVNNVGTVTNTSSLSMQDKLVEARRFRSDDGRDL